MTRRPPVPLAECRECHEPIVFARLDTGKAIPLNPLPNEKGNVAARLQGGRLLGFVISRDRLPGPLDPYRFMPHHATCEARKPKPTPEPPALF